MPPTSLGPMQAAPTRRAVQSDAPAASPRQPDAKWARPWPEPAVPLARACWQERRLLLSRPRLAVFQSRQARRIWPPRAAPWRRGSEMIPAQPTAPPHHYPAWRAETLSSVRTPRHAARASWALHLPPAPPARCPATRHAHPPPHPQLVARFASPAGPQAARHFPLSDLPYSQSSQRLRRPSIQRRPQRGGVNGPCEPILGSILRRRPCRRLPTRHYSAGRSRCKPPLCPPAPTLSAPAPDLSPPARAPFPTRDCPKSHPPPVR